MDLRKLTGAEKERVDKWIEKLLYREPAVVNGIIIDPNGFNENWLIHSSTISGRRQMYLFQTDPMSFRSVECILRTVSTSGVPVDSIRFRVGEFVSPETVTFADSKYGFPCLVVETSFAVIKSPIEYRQFYCVTDDAVELLRCEKPDGSYMKDDLKSFGGYGITPEWPDWQRLLESSERLQQLRGLVALWKDGERKGHIDASDKVRDRLTELSTSPDPWISEEAKLALEEAKKK
jgi:hypothetical protein